jgi:ABC-type Na+ transport system ATPase subunit NatA
MQDDIVMGMLTVRENIEFSAALRLPSSTSAEQRRERVDEIISDLGLSRCASTRVSVTAAQTKSENKWLKYVIVIFIYLIGSS